ncbi:PLP-dependent aminotransferase family protein [Nocardia sp. CA-135953]|uniref:MocR-like pyridoxine biosynthesis transcription factor PdxR n=1 Tax=Nocardia sp. CA-135953 TaxID=3239978 RepID=UPI003D988829
MTVRVQEAIKQAIRNGHLAAGAQLPPSRTLARELHCSRSVVVNAYGQLTMQGFLRSRRGSGTVVAEGPAAAPAPRLPVRPPTSQLTFAAGVADLSSFPRTEWTNAIRHVMSTASRDDLQYSSPNGNAKFREALAERLARIRGVAAQPHDIHVCGGTVQSISLLARVLADEGHSTIAVENPSWDRLRPPLESVDLQLVPIRVDDEGICVADLWAHPDVRVVLLTPAHQFPTGVIMSDARRSELLEWATRRNALVIEDDYDAEFNYGTAAVHAVQSTMPDRVVYLGTTSKILSPALRLGWMVTPTWMTPRVNAIREHFDLGVPVIDQLALTYLITTGLLDRHLRRTRPKYNRRRHALISALHAELDGIEISSAPAGLHLLVRFPNICAEDRLVAEAARLSLPVLSLQRFRLEELQDNRPTLVLGYANMTEDSIVAGARVLAQAWRAVRARPDPQSGKMALPAD